MMRSSTVHLKRSRRAFSLIEIIVAVAILLVIMLWVTYVYRSVTQAVGAGHSVASAARDSRGAHSILYNDLKCTIQGEDPYFMIVNQRRSAFLRFSDQRIDKDKNPDTVDIDQDGLTDKPGEDLSRRPASINYRNCRTDLLGFFIRGVHRKQTGSQGQIVSPMGTRDAYVWYGHLRQAGELGGAKYFDPGEADPDKNPVNFYSSDWVLGRFVMLLSHTNMDQLDVPQVAIDTPSATGHPLPLAYGAIASRELNPELRFIQTSRNDLVLSDVGLMSEAIKTVQFQNPDFRWWEELVFRFQAIPQPNVPLNGDGAALSAPLFLQHCRQFAVEYAGDFVTQKLDVCGARGLGSPPDGFVNQYDLFHPDYGQVIAAEPDGKLDFFTVPTGKEIQFDEFKAFERVQRIRFYGLPRDTDGAQRIPGWIPNRRTNDLAPVVPLADVVRSGSIDEPNLANYVAPFEREVPPSRADYAAEGALRPDAIYVCMFGPSDPRPRLIRVVVTLEDPDERMGVGMSQEYVFQLGR